jgi:hypothetical protein
VRHLPDALAGAPRPFESDLTDAMFLGEGVGIVISEIRSRRGRSFRLAERVNVFGNAFLFSTQVKRHNVQQAVVSTLLPRVLSALQGCVVVSERGLLSEAVLLARKVLEVTFRLVAVAKSQDVATKYVQLHDLNRLRLLEKLKQLKCVRFTPEERLMLDDAKAKSADAAKVAGLKALSTKWFAEEAGMLDFYNSLYAFWSQSAHATIGDLNDLVETRQDGSIDHFRYGPETDGLDHLLCSVIECVLIALEASFGVLPGGRQGELQVLRDEMLALHDDAESAR